MIDVTPTESDSLRELRRIGPLVQALFTVAIAIAACTVALVWIGPASAPTPAATPAPALPQQLAAGPKRAQDGAFVPATTQAAGVRAEAPTPTR
jgi:hypothetical protein